MKRFFWMAAVCLTLLPCAKSQETGKLEVGAFADYYRAEATGTNMFGLGGRFGFGLTDSLVLEGEMSYDFSRTFVNSFTETTGGSVSFINSNVSTLHTLIGPRYDLGRRRIRPFVELKGGFIDYRFGPLASGFTSFENDVANLRSQNLNGALLAGGGLEGTLGPVGLRLDVGDEMYFNHGAHNGLKVMFGPVLRF
jgi:hypothetical protein